MDAMTMFLKRIGVPSVFLVLLGCGDAAIGEVADADSISNYREYSTMFASSGQPDADQLAAIKEGGYERIIYLAFSDQHSSLAEEDRIVSDLGMDYVHIPVRWDGPKKNRFAVFAAVMEQGSDIKTLVHCQVNYRASVFSLLYRVIYKDVALEDAKEDMNSVWAPNETWRQFIFDVLEDNGIDADCDVCDWDV